MKNLINFDKKISNKFPFIFLFFCYWINTYSTLGSKVILFISSEDNLFENLSFILILISALYILRSINLKMKVPFSSKDFTLLFLFVFLLIWAIEEISWGERIFNFTWDDISIINSQNEINLHNLKSVQPHLHKSYYILGLLVSFCCILKKKSKNSLLPDKSILYFFLLPALYYLIGEIFLNFPLKIQGEFILKYHLFYFQEVNEFLLALGAFLYSLRVYRIKKFNL
tara:strand:+ start:162 stop:842 length:681 start_codon:yes stop_codon:yes gene_type:complete